jgi:cellulose synthase/poly-beta-1,6-N-acetylglucosamine synthase-like glycosyltransferase
MAMRPARRSFRRPLLIGVAMLGLLWFLFGRGGSAATYDPAQAALAYPEHTTNDPDDPTSTSRVHASIVVPCYHEKDNLRPLVTRVFAAVTDKSRVEIVLVDDNSRDGTVEEVEKLRAEGHNVRVIVRTAPGEKGLSSAVLRGFQEARGTNLVCMDADLQVSISHNPVP